MNSKMKRRIIKWISFRPQQGLPIMNSKKTKWGSINGFGFRPQQGLPIMNCSMIVAEVAKSKNEFPSPTGVTYYESLPTKP